MKRLLGIFILCLISGVGLWLTFRGVGLGPVVEIIRDKKGAWPWFLLSGLFMVFNIGFRGLRYDRILAAFPQVSFWRAQSITALMFLGNSILPFRAGEAIRVVLPNRLFGIPLSTSMVCHGVDRLFDMAGMLTCLFVCLAVSGNTILPNARNTPLDFFGTQYTFDHLIQMIRNSSLIILVLGVIFVTLLIFTPRQFSSLLGLLASPFGKKFQQKIIHSINHMVQGIGIFKNPRDILLASLWTFFLWYMVILNVQVLCSIFGVDLNWAQAGLIVFLVATAVTLPQAPGYVGGFHFGFRLSLEICFGVPAPTAVAIAWMAWCFQIFPVILTGLVGMLYEGISFHAFAEAKQTLEQSDPEGGNFQ